MKSPIGLPSLLLPFLILIHIRPTNAQKSEQVAPKAVDKKPDEEVWVDLRPAAAIAQIFTFIALMIYVFNILSQCMCETFRPLFFRQLAYIFQTIRMFLLMAALLPCLLHGQVRSVSPNLTDGYFAASVLLALLGNILVAIGIRKFFECNRESLLCLWRWLPFTQQSVIRNPLAGRVVPALGRAATHRPCVARNHDPGGRERIGNVQILVAQYPNRNAANPVVTVYLIIDELDHG
ncbi:hypothetical protein RRG08_028295 [Elysia crispata]|uniref:Uncharacterized protein n=1 Tax=Elysia crispata TaxID=231223 RepID=A0AAE1AWB2_9GAST|nr:hypothetical protein RRG08_028295 [Elysia crispata]